MGGGGSIQGMRTSLKNNSNLLKGRRKGFFKRELSYAEIRTYNKESTDPIAKEKGSNTIQLREIREKLIRERKRYNYVQVALFISVLAFIVYGAVSFLSDTSSEQNEYQKNRESVSVSMERDPYEKHMSLGYLDEEAKE